MASIGIVLKNGLNITSKLPPISRLPPGPAQRRVLTKLLRKAQLTDFGQEYHFAGILASHSQVRAFKTAVPMHTYETMQKWWNQTLQGERSVAWPGRVDYFALSSGTSSGSSKYIPVTRSMLKAIQKGSIRQIMSLANCKLPQSFFEKDIMMLGGSTNLEYNGIHYAGDLSGITTGNLPMWFQPFYKPGKGISRTKNWQDKLDLITTQAHRWDVGAIVGVPSWFQLLMERIIAHYNVKTIHDVWPNLQVFTHGGVAFEPYRNSFEKLLAKPLIYLETYLASEGFIAYQDRPEAEGMKMHLRNGIFYEFVPFNDRNFDGDGNIKETAETYLIDEVKTGLDYALLLSSCAGAWRYAIGDVVRFTDLERCEIIITGRTKHFLSLCGEHLSVDNMNKAIELLSGDMDIDLKEFTVAGEEENGVFGHHWYISADKELDLTALQNRLDARLSELNDDYKVERMHALKNLTVEALPNSVFLDFLRSEGKEGAQAKFPRVVKAGLKQRWQLHVKDWKAANK